MSEDSEATNHGQKGMTRRQFLKAMVVGGASLFLGGCRRGGSESSVSQPFSEITPEKASELTQKGLEKIKRIREHPEEFGLDPNVLQSFMKMVNETYPGISLTYTGNPYIEHLRKQPLPEAILLAIAGLNLEKSLRYNRPNTYVCNVYALDLVRALLGNDVIGDRYHLSTGEPYSFGLRDLDWGNNQLVEENNQNYPFFHGNNFDWWARNYGERYGWRRVKTLEELRNLGANVIGVYCSSLEEIARQRRTDANFLGHLGVFFFSDPNNLSIIARSQATNHYPYQVLPTNHDLLKAIEDGRFSLYVHSYSPLR
jgi:hypothetical protein